MADHHHIAEEAALQLDPDFLEDDSLTDLERAVWLRHSVRAFEDRPIAEDVREKLEAAVAEANAASGLTMRLAFDEPEAFTSMLAHYGRFENVKNYLVVCGPNDKDLDMKAGYFGEKIVLLAQQLGLNSCWVATTFKRRVVRASLTKSERMVVVIALGYGKTQGRAHRTKTAPQVSKPILDVPDWFRRGVSYALLAPTSLNQQSFWLMLTRKVSTDNKLKVSLSTGGGPKAKVDLGIVKLHFEIGAGLENFAWEAEWF